MSNSDRHAEHNGRCDGVGYGYSFFLLLPDEKFAIFTLPQSNQSVIMFHHFDS
jgi:hypothetical protein